MHEMAFVRRVVEIVVERAETAGVSAVSAVYLTIGYGRDIVEEYFDGLFQHLARGTAAEHAELVINRTPITVCCNKCGFIFSINVLKKETWVCPLCKTEKDYQIQTGMEFIVNHIEFVGNDRTSEQSRPCSTMLRTEIR